MDNSTANYLPRKAVRAETTTPSRIVAEYIYYNVDQTPAYKVKRYFPKGFTQAHYRAGCWVSGLGPFKNNPLPYNLPSIMMAVQSDRPILLVEGEKDAKRLIEAGYDATCNNGG